MKALNDIRSEAHLMWNAVLFDAVLAVSAILVVIGIRPTPLLSGGWAPVALCCVLVLTLPAWCFSRTEMGKLNRKTGTNRTVNSAGTALSFAFLLLMTGITVMVAVSVSALRTNGPFGIVAPVTSAIGGAVLLMLRVTGHDGAMVRPIVIGSTLSALLFEAVVIDMARVSGVGAPVVFVAAGMLVASTVAAISFVGIYSFVRESAKKMGAHGGVRSTAGLLASPLFAFAAFEWAVLVLNTETFRRIPGFAAGLLLFAVSGLLLARSAIGLSRKQHSWEVVAGTLAQLLAFLALWSMRP
jgi:hypothetical protein